MSDLVAEGWFTPSEKLPNDMEKVEFIPKSKSTSIEKGYFIKSENLFFGSFEEETDNFHFSLYVLLWRPLKTETSK